MHFFVFDLLFFENSTNSILLGPLQLRPREYAFDFDVRVEAYCQKYNFTWGLNRGGRLFEGGGLLKIFEICMGAYSKTPISDTISNFRFIDISQNKYM